MTAARIGALIGFGLTLWGEIMLVKYVFPLIRGTSGWAGLMKVWIVVVLIIMLWAVTIVCAAIGAAIGDVLDG